jgi:hypothetical protein
MRALKIAAVAVVVLGFTLAAVAGVQAAAVRGDAGFNTNNFPGNDDGSLSNVALGFSINFFGVNTSTTFLNNNGNITFDSGLSTFTPFALSTTNRKIIAPFFGDVDTRAGNTTKYGNSTIDGHTAFGVNWINVGYYSVHTNKLNSFQLVLIDRSDTGAGNFDFEFNYDDINWETGDASGGSNGLGGSPARVGWSNGAANTFELTGSASSTALLDSNCDAGGSTGLICHSLNSDVLGRYLFSVRNGQVIDDTPSDDTPSVPLPGTLMLLGAGFLALASRVALKRAK